MQIIKLIFSTEIACMKSHPGGELCAPLLLDFNQ